MSNYNQPQFNQRQPQQPPFNGNQQQRPPYQQQPGYNQPPQQHNQNAPALFYGKTNEELAVRYEVDGNNIELTPAIIKEYIAPGANISLAEYKYFVDLCKVRKLNPFLKEAYLIKYGSQPAQVHVGKDAILKRAILHPKFNGRRQGIIVKMPNGQLDYRAGTFRLSDETLVGGWAEVFRKDWDHPVYITVAFEEVAQTKQNGDLNSNWATKGATMVEKVALVRALREAFVEDLGGMIDADEAWSNEHLNIAKNDVKTNGRANTAPIIEQPEVIDVEVKELGSINDL